jgi:DNA-binding transcriptional ArsR family regulator
MQAVFDALAEPNRRAILELLVERERSVGEIEQRLRLPQPSISKHLRLLRDTGFVEARAEAQKRVYRLRAEPLMALDNWLEPYRGRWKASLDALERHLDRMPETRTGKDRQDEGTSRTRGRAKRLSGRRRR